MYEQLDHIPNIDVSMQVQPCKDKAYTSVKVVTEYDRFQCINHRDELDRLTLDLDSIRRRKGQISMPSITEMSLTVPLGTCTIACMYANILYLALA